MRLIIALLLPWLTFFTIGRPFAGIICLILQITLIGWIPATLWAVYALSQYKTDKKIEKAMLISPIVDMERLILDMMIGENVSDEELSIKKEIETSLG